MAINKVKEYFSKFGKEKDIYEFNESSATVKEASERLNCNEELIAKTLSFMVFNKPILIVLPGNVKIDNTKYKAVFNTKAKMLSQDEVKTLIGHEIGGVCPFAINDGVTVYLDISLKKYEYVYPACGNDKSAIKLSISELEKYSNFDSYIDVGKIS